MRGLPEGTGTWASQGTVASDLSRDEGIISTKFVTVLSFRFLICKMG